jgi:type IV pilus assembly protein PilW
MKPAIPARSVVRPLHRLQHGFSLIELMIALVLGMLIMAAALAVYININSANSELAKVNSQIESGRFATQLLENDVVHAGFWGTYVPEFDDLTFAGTPGDAPTAVPDPCLTYNTANWNTIYQNNLIGIPVQAYDAAAVCGGVITSKQANTDVLVVRHTETCLPGTVNCEAYNPGKLYFQGSLCETEIGPPPAPAAFRLDTGANITGAPLHNRNCTTVADQRKFISNIYYVRNYSVTPGDGIPTLVRSQFDLSGGTLAHQAAQSLIEGIDGFRVELGIDSRSKTGAAVDYTVAINWTDPNNLTTPTNRGDGIPEGAFVHCTTGTPCTAAQLTNVTAVKLFVLARAKDPSTGYTDTKTYCVGTPNTDGSCPAANTLGPFNDNYKRHVFSTTIRLTDVGGRRETPP